MSADELRAGFSRLAERVVPMEDPHGRLMLRRRKRFRNRLVSIAAVTATVVTGGLAAPATLLNAASSPSPENLPEVVEATPPPSSSEYLQRLVNAPVRGNLSGDPQMVTDVQRAFSETTLNQMGMKEANLVFLNRTKQMLQAVVIYTSGDEAIAVARGAEPNGSVKDLLAGGLDASFAVSPFLVVPVASQEGVVRSVVGLAPPGCAIDRSTKGGFSRDGAWSRTYEPEPTVDYVTREGHAVNELWRVSCDGRVREVRIADDYLDKGGIKENPASMYERVVRFSGLAPGDGTVQWRGTLPGFKSEAILVAPQPRPGPAMLAVGPFPKAVIATDLAEKAAVPSPAFTGAGEEWSMIGLGVAGEGVTAVRLPQPFGGRTVLGDRVFVYTETGAARIEAIDRQKKMIATAPVSDNGVAILTFRPGAVDEIRAVSSSGAPRTSVRFIDLEKGSRLLGDQLFKDW